MTVVKICGIRDEETASQTAAARADMIGMVFAESRRQVKPSECLAIVSAVQDRRRHGGPAILDGPRPGEVSPRTWFHAWAEAIADAVTRFRPLTVGVFADQTAAEVNDIADAAGLDLVQLSGGETIDFATEIERPVILVRHVSPGATEDHVLKDIRPGPAAVMLDTATRSARGGSGISFDWRVAAAAGARLPVILAGGLDPTTVASAIGQAHPWAVDVSSGVETKGRKDINKIRAFIGAAKGAVRG